MRVKANALSLVGVVAAMSLTTAAYGQDVAEAEAQNALEVAEVEAQDAQDVADAEAADAQEKAAEVINEAAAAGDKSFEEALDEAEESASSLLSDGDEAPYLFEYEYEYEYDSNFNPGFRRPGAGAAGSVAGSGESAGDQQDRIEEAQQALAEAQQFAPKSRVREQFVQLGGESLSTIGLTGLGDLVATGARGLLVTPTEFSASSLDISLRGIGGTTVDQVTGESGVGVFLDGVPVLRGQSYSLGLIDLESMDMLRGSRGVVAGRNAVGGAIYMNSRKPDGEFGFRQRVRFGLAYDDVQSITNIDLPQVVGLPMARISYLASANEGPVENIQGTDASNFGEKSNEAFRIALTSVPSDAVSIDFAIERSDLESTHHYYQAISANNAPPVPVVVESAYRDTARSSIPLPLSKTDQTSASLVLSIAPSENFEIKPILGWTEINDDSFVNFDGRMGPLNEGESSLESFDNRVAYYELQANGRLFNNLLNYSIGFSGTDDSSDYKGAIADGEADLESVSTYLQTVWVLSESLKLTAGIRETEDEKDFSRSRFDDAPDLSNEDTALREAFLNESYTDYALAVDYDISKTLKAYASYATAHKAGGVSLFGQTEGGLMRIYDAEEATTMQLGVKGSAVETRLYYDIAVFSTDIEDRQVVFHDPDNRRLTDIVNATDTATISGMELDLRFKVSEAIRVGAFVTVLDVDDNTVAPVYAGVDGGPYTFDPDNAIPQGQGGTAFITSAPELSYALTADFKFGVGQSRDSVFRLEYVGIDDYHYNAFTEFTDSRSILNARLLFSGFELEGADDGKVEISLWAENILDEEYIVNAAHIDSNPAGVDQSFVSGAFGEPITYGIDIDFVF